MSYCDWLTIHQDFPRHDPFHDGWDDRTDRSGDYAGRYYRPRDLPGLFESKLRIVSDGTHLSVDGNPSRFNRPDSVVGLSVEDAKEVVQDVLAANGLPVFDSQAVVTRCDMAANVDCGSRLGLRDFMRFQSLQKYPRLGLSEVGTTVYHGRGSRSREIRIYEKGPELAKRAKGKRQEWKRPVVDHYFRLSEACRYYARIETEYRSWLRSAGQRSWSSLCGERMEVHFMKDVAMLVEDFEAMDLSDLSMAELKLVGVWRMGFMPRECVSDATFYRHRKSIKAKLGLDISLPFKDVSQFPKQVAVSVVGMPQGYDASVVTTRGDILKFKAVS